MDALMPVCVSKYNSFWFYIKNKSNPIACHYIGKGVAGYVWRHISILMIFINTYQLRICRQGLQDTFFCMLLYHSTAKPVLPFDIITESSPNFQGVDQGNI